LNIKKFWDKKYIASTKNKTLKYLDIHLIYIHYHVHSPSKYPIPLVFLMHLAGMSSNIGGRRL
jgi:hypothetical protein